MKSKTNPLLGAVLLLLVTFMTLWPSGYAKADPIVQQAYLKAFNADAQDLFGSSVAISGNTAVVGAPNEADGIGAAYVFVRNGSNWTFQAYLKPEAQCGFGGGQFGSSVAIYGNTIVVGALFDRRTCDEQIGAAYVFVRQGTAWTQQALLKTGIPSAVAVSRDTVAVGVARWGYSIVHEDPDFGSYEQVFTDLGAVFVFVRDGSTWSLQTLLRASNSDEYDWLGSSVAIDGNTIVAGAPHESSNARSVNGNESDNSATAAGAAYVFVRNGTNWTQQAYLKASNADAGDGFGSSVAISGNTVLVGAVGEDSRATGVNGNQTDNSFPDSGAVYTFVRSGATWSPEAYLKASNTEPPDTLPNRWPGFRTDLFGSSVAIEGGTAVVGAPWEDSGATGVDGNQFDNSAENAGAAYVFTRGVTGWAQVAYLKASNADFEGRTFDNFGWAVAISSGTAVVGARGEDSAAAVINGDQNDNSALSAGAAYVFTGFEATAIDNTPPTITCPPTVTVQGLANVPPTDFAGGIVSDDQDANPLATFEGDVIFSTCPMTIARTYKAIDESGNSASCTQIITVNNLFADDVIIWHQPLARNGASEDTDPSAGGTVKYRFKRGSTIPVQIHALSCAGADVTSNANVIATVTVFGDSNCDGAIDDSAVPIDFNGVGGGGGVMDKIGSHLKYNLDTQSLPTTTQCYILRVTVTDTSTGEEKFEEVLLQAK